MRYNVSKEIVHIHNINGQSSYDDVLRFFGAPRQDLPRGRGDGDASTAGTQPALHGLPPGERFGLGADARCRADVAVTALCATLVFQFAVRSSARHKENFTFKKFWFEMLKAASAMDVERFLEVLGGAGLMGASHEAETGRIGVAAERLQGHH